MTRRARIVAFGSATALVLAGVVCAIVLGGKTRDVLATTLITLGLGAIVLLAFLEVGLSEDRELAREEERRRKEAAKRPPERKRPPRPRRPRRPI